MAFISKIKLANGQIVDLKDALAQSNISTLVGEHGVVALGDAAWEDVAESISGSGLIDAATVKEYVDAQVGAIHNFDVKIYQTLPTASEDTMYILALVPEGEAAAPGAYIEHITVRSGSEGAYTYAWEQIGSTDIDLTDYLKTAEAEAFEVAGVAFGTDHKVTAAELSDALDLQAFAHADEGEADVSYDKVSAITMKAVEVSGNATVSYATADANLTKASFTPAGSVSGTVTAAGNVSVVLKPGASANASVAYSSYTPEGNVVVDSSFAALKSVELSQGAVGEGIQISGICGAPDANLAYTPAQVMKGVTSEAVLPTFSEGAFTAATWTGSNYTAPTWTGSSYSAPSLGSASFGSFATEGIMASVNVSASAGDADFELLVFTNAVAANAVTDRGSFDAGSLAFGSFNGGDLSFGAFDGGSKASDTFDQGAAATYSYADVIPSGATVSVAAPSFSGGYIKAVTDTDTAIKTVSFSGSAIANGLVTGVTYVQPEVSAATFSGSEVNISAAFSGSEAANVIVTGVTYDKANASAAFDVSVTPEVSNIAFSTITSTVTVSPKN